MGWSAQYFTTIIIEGNTPNTGLFIYAGAPAFGNLIGSWAAQAGTDPQGNAYPAGINVFQGQLTGVGITNATITASSIMNAAISASAMTGSAISGGSIRESTIIFDSGGGVLFGYTTTTNTQTFSSPGLFTYTAPITGTAQVTCSAGDAGAGGGSSTVGGEGGGAGECAINNSYPIVLNQVYNVQVGLGGTGGITGNAGLPGGDSTFDNGGVQAQGGQAGAAFIGGLGGFYNTAPIAFPGGNGGGDGTQSTGGCGGGGRAGSTGAGGNGAKSTSSAGAAGGAAGSGTGGHVGGAGGAANNGGNGGGAGGGAGAAAGATNHTFTYRLLSSATYFGSDASSGAPPNHQKSTGTMYQGGETASGGGFNGTMKSLGIIAGNPVSDLSGVTIDQVTIRLENLHSWYNSGINVILGYNSNSSLPSSYNVSGQTQVATYAMGEGATHTQDITGGGLGTAMANGSAKCITLGPGSPFLLNNYGYFYGAGGDNNQNPLITIKGHTGAGAVQGGNGTNGFVTVTVTASSALDFVLSPVAGTDPASGTAYQAGISSLNPGGRLLRLRGEDTDNSTLSANTTAFSTITKLWGIPANDPIVGTGYRLRAWGTGVYPAVAGSLNIRGNYTGAGGLGAIPVGAGEFPVSTAFKWYIESVIVIEGIGASQSYISYTTLTLAQSATNQLTTAGSQAAGQFMSTGGAGSGINTTAAAQMWIESEWVTNSGTLTCVGSTFTPIGP